MLFRLNGFLLMAAMLFAGCTSEQQIRKSALRYFKDGNSAYLHRDYQNAIWNYRKAITMDSETPEFHFNLGLVYYELGNYPEALDAYMRVAELRPGLSDTYYNIALAYHRMEQSTDADRYYNRYQDMLSLRKAKELARKKAEMKQQEQPAVAAETKPVKAKSPKAVVKKPVVKKMNPTLASTQKTPSKLKFSNPPRKGTGSIPNWE